MAGPLLLLITGRPAAAQLDQRPCDMSIRTIDVRVVEAAGRRPAGGIEVRVTRLRGGSPVGGVRRTAADGRVALVRDGELPMAAESLAVVFSRGTAARRVTYVVGPDAGRCHLQLLAGPTTVRWPRD